MTIVGITMVRDEADIISTVLRHMASQVDALVIADNRSVDGTADILQDARRSLGIPIKVVVDDDVGYQQSTKMTALAHRAHEEFLAEWVVPFDADEIWVAPEGNLSEFLEDRSDDENVVTADLYDHVATGHDDLNEVDPVKRIEWRRSYANPLPKVAARWDPRLVIGMGNHDIRLGSSELHFGSPLAIRHFPYRSPEQIVRKVRNGAEAYAATTLPEHYGAHWRQWGQILNEQGEEAIVELFRKWYWQRHPGQELTIEGETQPALIKSPAYEVMSIW